jgi:hypothetical protein
VKDLTGENFSQFGSVDAEANGTPHVVAVSAFDHASLQGMCQSVVTNLGPLGNWTLQLHAGDTKPVDAKNLLIDMNQLNADAEFTNMNIGQDASTLTGSAADIVRKSKKGLPTGAQGFAQAAESAHLTGVQQTAWATSAGTFTLNGLKLNIVQGSGAGVECY